MIEDEEGIKNLDQILTVEGLDIIAIGPNDLAAALGHPGNPGHADVQKTIDEIVAQTRAAGKAVGVGGNSTAESVSKNIQRGATYLTLGYGPFIGQSCRAPAPSGSRSLTLTVTEARADGGPGEARTLQGDRRRCLPNGRLPDASSYA